MARITAGLCLFTLAMTGAAAVAGPDPAGLIEAGIVNGAVAAGPAGGSLAVLARGTGWRDMPVISPDGTRVAFVQQADAKVALADVVVVGLDGREISRTHVEPVQAGVAYTGMQYVEMLQWISPTRLVAGGSINPSTSQYYMIDAPGGGVVRDFTDDASAPAFSPDGNHMAVLVDAPHFTPAAESTPRLMLDETAVWRPAAGATLAGPARFSPDGTQLAWVGRAASGATALDVWSGGTLHSTALPAPAGSAMHVLWSGGHAVAVATPLGVPGRALAWSADAAGGVHAQVPADADADALALRAQLVRQAAQAGVKSADFWCRSCSLSVLPRVAR